MRKKINLVLGLAVLLLSCFLVVTRQQNVAAVSTVDSIKQKTLLTGLRACYMNGDFVDTLKTADYDASLSAIGGVKTTVIDTNGYNYYLALPNGYYGNTVKANCAELLIGNKATGANAFGGAREIIPYSTPMGSVAAASVTKTEVDAYMKGLGYTVGETAASADTKCFALEFNKYTTYLGLKKHDTTFQTNVACLSVNASGETVGFFTVDSDDPASDQMPTSLAKFDVVAEDGGGQALQLTIRTKDTSWHTGLEQESLSVSACDDASDGKGCNIDVVSGYFSGFMTGLEEKHSKAVLSDDTEVYIMQFGIIKSDYYKFVGTKKIDLTEMVGAYTHGASIDPPYGKGPFAGYKDYPALALSDTEKFTLYSYYITNFYNGDKDESLVCTTNDEIKGALSARSSDYKKFNATDSTGKTMSCFAHYPRQNAKKTVHGLTSDNYFILDWALGKTFDEIVAALNGITIEEAIPEGSVTVDDPAADSDPADGTVSASSTNVCVSTAGALGWIICPIIKVVGSATQGIYTTIVEPFLQINPTLLSQEENSDSTYGGWRNFRDFANILFAILFIVVILAQITGIGITNYNIKKILPRLIVVVVLVNISFILCQVAVDLSNILGKSLYDLFYDFASKVGLSADEFTAPGIFGTIIDYLITDGAALFGLALILSKTVHLWLIPFLLALIAAAVSALFFLIILGVRQAAIIILVVISPIAIVLYALPNTKKLFDKWLSMFKAALLVYPICGALMGGSQYASALLMKSVYDAENNGDASIGGLPAFFLVFAALLVSVVPFFFIPSILRSSMRGIADLGNRISKFGGGLSKGITSSIRKSERAKEFQSDLNLAADRRRVNRLDRRLARGKTLSTRQKKARYRSRSRVLAAENQAMLAKYDDRVIPDAEAPVGSAAHNAYQTMQAGIKEKLMADRVKEQKAHITSGGMANVNPADEESLGQKYGELLSYLDRNPDDEAAVAQLRAVGELLNAKGDPGRKQIKRSLARYTSGENFQSLIDPKTGKLKEGTPANGLTHAMAHLDQYDKFRSAIHNTDKGLEQMVGDYAKGNFADILGKGEEDIKGYYGAQGADGYSGEMLVNAAEDALTLLEKGVQEGRISGSKLGSLFSAASEAYSNDRISAKPKVKNQIGNILSACMAAGASPHEPYLAGTTGTAGTAAGGTTGASFGGGTAGAAGATGGAAGGTTGAGFGGGAAGAGFGGGFGSSSFGGGSDSDEEASAGTAGGPAFNTINPYNNSGSADDASDADAGAADAYDASASTADAADAGAGAADVSAAGAVAPVATSGLSSSDSDGAMAMAEASASTLLAGAGYIARVNDGRKFSANDRNTAAYKQVQGMAENVYRALTSGRSFSDEQVKAMDKILTNANEKGVTSISGNRFATVKDGMINGQKINIRDAKAAKTYKPKALPPLPEGVDAEGRSTDPNRRSGLNKLEQTEYNLYLKKTAKVRAWNVKHGFNPDGSVPAPATPVSNMPQPFDPVDNPLKQRQKSPVIADRQFEEKIYQDLPKQKRKVVGNRRNPF